LQGWVPEHEATHAPVARSHDVPEAHWAELVQYGTHVPPTQALPVAQTKPDPQPPQLLSSVW